MGLTQVVEQLKANICLKRGEIQDLAYKLEYDDCIRRVQLEVVVEELELVLDSLKAVLIDEHESRGGCSWITNPDRMGGCYTEQEIAESRGCR